MAKNASTGERQPASRWNNLLLGLFLGFVWGTVMWALATLFGRDSGGVKGWLYLAVSIAMIGGGIAAVFGAVGAKKRGERVSPRFRRR